MLFLRQAIPPSYRDDVHQKRRHNTELLFCQMPEECAYLQPRPAEVEMDHVLRQEGTWLSTLASLTEKPSPRQHSESTIVV